MVVRHGVFTPIKLRAENMTHTGVIIITEKQIVTNEDRINLFLNSICLNMGKIGVLQVDRDHSNFKYYIKSAIQIANFYGDTKEKDRLQKEL
jgi:hypothetical protein